MNYINILSKYFIFIVNKHYLFSTVEVIIRTKMSNIWSIDINFNIYNESLRIFIKSIKDILQSFVVLFNIF